MFLKINDYINNQIKWLVLGFAILSIGLFAACGSDDDDSVAAPAAPAATAAPATAAPAATAAPEKLSGTIEIDGSSTVFPVTVAVAEEFRVSNPQVQIPIGMSGSGGGFKRFVVGETDISNASRQIKSKEVDTANDNGIELMEFRVAWDGLSVVVSKSNDFVDCLTTEELKSIWDEGSTLDNWSQVRAGFPDKPLRLYGPGTDSGTFDYFTDEINGEEKRSRADYTASEDDNTLVQGVSGDAGALGYFGFAYYVENTETLKLLGVDSGSGCVEPSSTTIENGTYSPLSRPLYIYPKISSIQKPEVKAFLEFYMDHGGELAAEVGYVALSDADYAAQKAMISNPVNFVHPSTAAPAATAAPEKLSGTIEIDGSSTVFPVTVAVAEEFRVSNPQVQIPIGMSGSGGGFKRFVVGETDISNASRQIKSKEVDTANDNGIELMEFRVAWDGLSVVVSKSNDFVDCLTTEELKSIWDEGSTLDNWSQVRAGFPDKPLRLYGPGTDSGTFDYFTDEINGEEKRSRADYTASEDDNTLVQGVSGDAGALGYFGFAYYVENTETLKLLGVDSGSGCVEPSSTTIENGTYSPLSRPLYIYPKISSIQKPEVKAFLEFYMDHGGELAAEVGYVALSDADYAAQKAMISNPVNFVHPSK